MMLSPCPSLDELSQFLSGRLESQTADWIEAHIDECDSCSSQLNVLDPGPDPLLADLKQPVDLAADPSDDVLEAPSAEPRDASAGTPAGRHRLPDG